MKRYLSSSALVLLFVLTGGAAHAQLLDTEGSLNADVNVTGEDASVDAGVSTDASVDQGAGQDTEGEPAEQSEMPADESGSALDASGVLDFSFDRNDLDGETQYAVGSVEDVRTGASLEAYANSLARDDERVESVSVAADGTDVKYRLDARFLGFIPGSVTANVRVDADGSVSVRYPWYSFLMMTDESRADLEARLSAELAAIEDDLNEEVSVGVGTNASLAAPSDAYRRALVLERLRASLYAGSGADAQE
jgi:hypothetical protein